MLPLTVQRNYYYLLFILVFCCFGLTSFTSSHTSTEYMSISLQHNTLSVDIVISGQNEKYRRIAVIHPWPRQTEQQQKSLTNHIVTMEKLGYEIMGINHAGRFDNSWVFDLFAEYGAKGWELHSYDLNIVQNFEPWYKRETEVYLFTRESELGNIN